MKSLVRTTAIAALSILSAGAFAGAFPAGPKPSASELLTQINAIQNPALDRSKVKDQTYVTQYIADMSKANAERNKLILELYQDYPENPEVPALLERRWQTMFYGHQAGKDELAAAIKETADIASSNAPAKVKESAFYFETSFKMRGEHASVADMKASAEQFIKAYPADERGAGLLSQIVMQSDDAAQKSAILAEIVKDFPNSRQAGFAAGQIRRDSSVGKPFELSFTDAITGKPVSIPDLKGKVVVLDFWATWCGPCVGEMPHMKELYAKYHDKGLEVIGVSLDQPESQGGLTSLKEFVAKNSIPWMQYYQGNYWDSKFSVSWGINSIPRTFILDKSGNLADADGGRGEALESKVSKLLGN